MQYHIEVQPAGVTYKSEDNLLEDALQQSITIEHSCKTGDCGVCSAELIQGKVENENGDIITEGHFLTCQSRAKSDSVLKATYVPELANIKRQTLPCKVASIEYPTSDIIIIKLRFPPTAQFDYLPGQYIDLSFKGVKRSYSIANTKSDAKEVELHIRRVDDGKMSQLLFDFDLKLNTLMRIEGPKGTFFVREGVKPLIMIATGTGIAPIKAAVEQLISNKDPRPVYIYWGMRYSAEIYDTGLESIAESSDNIHFFPVLSRERKVAMGKVGYVQSAVLQDFGSLELYDIYACGSPQMIEQAKESFEKNGLLIDNFFSDAFTPAK
ncbi:FAD-binding oxidoreductase [Vibrio neptunius]|uniref:2Fe-2S iron-sulfur cluster binding domain-containing protein n=1 Tax=Vibrio neptunius TaxID=170651 RepID=A0ABS3A1V9_9VIBR|nr:FAD-binding oxidoreductase [Vibrio neptunius]MBN3493432.1 2Fe-2S iron-sulfur cluster binding domain-containing protein [Vibrio neptunius]MBN3515874.1 2Fe-2S iron-sulfur cluster binding domain-containing protein [Vibrio neptunius]MBN3550101.1 2Fe-2S iron-sulfur cluster binding domain-containing protein [Vibrio neptunius]MBN3578179.1 2Fe-2S iron-sulfur cluster binding domain-containing protein [Vibrio neptunius]MCH9871843.1 2Fe-2S iron-sulfur cluster binding domain-containing protein [Vibrio 